MFATAWPGFHKFSRGPSRMTFFTGSPASGWTRNYRLNHIELPWVSLNITDGWVIWPHVEILSSMTAWYSVVIFSFMTVSYVDEFYDRVLRYWVSWSRDISSSFMTVCCDIEFYAHELCCPVLRPRVVILSFMPGAMLSSLWLRAWMPSELVACQKWWVSWLRD